MISALVLVLAAASSDLAAQVESKLSKDPVQVGTFDQSKQVKGFKKPLKSQGTYRVAKGEGVQWNTVKPFASQLTVTATEIVARSGETETFKLSAKEEPTVRVITTLLFSVLSGDLKSLESHFDATGGLTSEGWAIELTPHKGPLEKVFTRISIKGNATVSSVHMTEASGDTTFIQLTPEGAAAPK